MGHYPTPVTRKHIDDWVDGWSRTFHHHESFVYVLRGQCPDALALIVPL